MVATTVTQAFITEEPLSEPLGVLILDEASMAPLPFLCHHCWRFSSACFDWCLGKIDGPKWLNRIIFEELEISDIAKAYHDARVTLLDTQYRMVPGIACIPNQFLYQKTKDDPSSSHLTL